MTPAESLLYEAIRELSYVQCVENCKSGLCATSLGQDIIDRGLKVLNIRDLSAYDLYEAKTGMRR